jgi:pyridoxamine 5'-phosphate oxidase
MNFQDCIDFANKHRFCMIATNQGTQPRLRIVRLWFADQNGFYFQCGTYKPYYQQLVNNKQVEVCFFTQAAVLNVPVDNSGEPLKMMRVAGEIEFITDLKIRARCIKETHHIMEKIGVTEPSDPRFAVFYIKKGEAYFWDREKIEEESRLEKIKFGK